MALDVEPADGGLYEHRAPREALEEPGSVLGHLPLELGIVARRRATQIHQKAEPHPPQAIEVLLEWVARDLDDGLMDAPWPPVYPKQPLEPPRVAPSRARKD